MEVLLILLIYGILCLPGNQIHKNAISLIQIPYLIESIVISCDYFNKLNISFYIIRCFQMESYLTKSFFLLITNIRDKNLLMSLRKTWRYNLHIIAS